MPEDIVNGQQAAGAHEGQRSLVVFGIEALVRVDKRKIKGVGLPRCQQDIEGFQGGAQMELDFVVDACCLPVALGDRAVVWIVVAGHDAPLGR